MLVVVKAIHTHQRQTEGFEWVLMIKSPSSFSSFSKLIFSLKSFTLKIWRYVNSLLESEWKKTIWLCTIKAKLATIYEGRPSKIQVQYIVILKYISIMGELLLWKKCLWIKCQRKWALYLFMRVTIHTLSLYIKLSCKKRNTSRPYPGTSFDEINNCVKIYKLYEHREILYFTTITFLTKNSTPNIQAILRFRIIFSRFYLTLIYKC